MSTQELKRQLDTLRQRQNDLTDEVEGARRDLKLAQTDQLEGKDGSTARVTAIQSQITGTTGTLEMLSEKIADAERDLEASQTADDVESRTQAILNLSEQASAAQTDYEAARAELYQAFEAGVQKIADGWQRWADAVKAADLEAKAVKATGINGSDLAEELEARGADLSAVASEFMLRGNFTGKRFRYVPEHHGRYSQPLFEAVHKAGIVNRIEAERAKIKKNGAAVAEAQETA